MDSLLIKELANAILVVAQETKSLYLNSTPSPELEEALEALWDSCQEYQTTFENFSHR